MLTGTGRRHFSRYAAPALAPPLDYCLAACPLLGDDDQMTLSIASQCMRLVHTIESETGSNQHFPSFSASSWHIPTASSFQLACPIVSSHCPLDRLVHRALHRTRVGEARGAGQWWLPSWGLTARSGACGEQREGGRAGCAGTRAYPSAGLQLPVDIRR